jgi:tetratricopeptide (TPR) repeat protein
MLLILLLAIQDDVQGEIVTLTRRIRENPADPGLYAERARRFVLLRRHEEAARDLSRALELDPKFDEACVLRSEAWLALRRPEEALRDAKRATELAPKSGAGPRAQARALAALDRFDEAAQACLEAARLGGARPEDLYLLKDEAIPVLKERKGTEAVVAKLEAVVAERKGREAEIRRLVEQFDESAKGAGTRLRLEGVPALRLLVPDSWRGAEKALQRRQGLAREILRDARDTAVVRAAVALVRLRWTDQDFKDAGTMLRAAFRPMELDYARIAEKSIGDHLESADDEEFQKFKPLGRFGGKRDLLTRPVADALDRGEGIVFLSVDEEDLLSPRSPVAVFTLPGKSGWSSYAVVRVK